MTAGVELRRDSADARVVESHLRACDPDFDPPLSQRVDIAEYARRLVAKAVRFEAWREGSLAGLVAAYANAGPGGPAFITNVSILPGLRGQGLAERLVRIALEHLSGLGYPRVELEVGRGGGAAIALYRKLGFRETGEAGSGTMTMAREVTAEAGGGRDYDAEIVDSEDRKYAYGFDFDVMHPFMIRSFRPFYRPGSVLELGSFRGDFTRRLLEDHADVTCVEASAEALSEARDRLGDRVNLIHSTFEEVELPRRYDNIVLTHVLEHLDDPVGLLRRINSEWLADGGRLFLVCPNANAPSRQIAVKMGLISHNAAVTPAEAAHGHRCTYALDTLERDAVSAGLRVVHRSGIFFKALANFQWDRLLQTDIISPEYLEGCYQLGQQYPDLCSSIFLLCERGGQSAQG
jgi:ribosomal protein S18 acetylase RimI-like enzyme/2-polyprenyl-3-methyl-5-hydroxy-6-metoxy-1,4-benzoquinol methylase